MSKLERLSTDQLFTSHHDDIMEQMFDAPDLIPSNRIAALSSYADLRDASKEDQASIDELGDLLSKLDYDLTPKEPEDRDYGRPGSETSTNLLELIIRLKKARKVLEHDDSTERLANSLDTEIGRVSRAFSKTVKAKTKRFSEVVTSRDDLYVGGFITDRSRKGTVAAQLLDLTVVDQKQLPHMEPVVRGVEGKVGLLPQSIRLFGVHALHPIDAQDKILVMSQMYKLTESEKKQAYRAYDEVRQIEQVDELV